MEKLWNDSWEFQLVPVGSEFEEVSHQADGFQKVLVPHDFLIEDTNRLYRDGDGWYKKSFCLSGKGKRYFLYFDGVYMNSTYFLNGKQIFEWKYGYSPFYFEITNELQEGENELFVRIRHQSPNSRWYSGAGIFRNVRLIEKNTEYLTIDGTYIHTEEKDNGYLVTVRTETETEAVDGESYLLVHTLKKGENEICLSKAELSSKEQENQQQFFVEQPERWSITNPELYTLTTTLKKNGTVVDEISQKIGFRTMRFDPQLGFFLNGEHIKLNGVCEHHDLGGLGAAFHAEAFRRKLTKLREMGVNAIRTSHNMVAREVLDLADEMGFLINAESFDMWELHKTQYDYAAYFDEWYKKDVRNFVRRDRNHACLLFFSIGNEIYDTHISERGQEVTRFLSEEFRKHDPLHNAEITLGSNYMPWENAQKCADIYKYAGYNYAEKCYEEHHQKHPDWVIYGSETDSTVQSRGVYHFPLSESVLADDDEQCSCLGNATTSWGARSTEACVISDRDAKFSLGQFLWSGFDYIGEPTPYNTKNSYFGQIDTAGFFKDTAYIFQAEWTDKKKAPMVHLFPYWDFSLGQLIDVRVCSNCPEVELFLNGESKGRFQIDHENGTQLLANYVLPYEPGELKAVAYNEKNEIVAADIEHSFSDAEQIVLSANKQELLTGYDDLIFVTIEAKDKAGYPVKNANNRIHVKVCGAGRLVALDNGDSTDYDQYKATSRRMFSGKLLAIIAPTRESGEITVSAASVSLKGATLTLTSRDPANENEIPTGLTKYPEDAPLPDNETAEKIFLLHMAKEHGEEAVKEWKRKIETEIPVRRVDLLCEAPEGRKLNKERNTATVTARFLPANATYRDFRWRATYQSGIDADFVELTDTATKITKKSRPEGLSFSDRVTLTAKGDGEIRVRCNVYNGDSKPRLISDIDFHVSGMGKAFLNPYEFIFGSLYTDSQGIVTNGNERGFATGRDQRTVVSFRDVDFSAFGSDEITLSVFELDSRATEIEVWEGIPGEEGAEKVSSLPYHKKTIWGVYQPQTYLLSRRLQGVTTISFVTYIKMHIKGFRFTEKQKAFETLYAAENDAIYGDSYKIEKPAGENNEKPVVSGIGNNVTLVFSEMDFSEKGADTLLICGKSKLEKNSIHVRFRGEDGSERNEIAEFSGPVSSEQEQQFRFERITGKQTVSFVFLPGCEFDFSWFRFQ